MRPLAIVPIFFFLFWHNFSMSQDTLRKTDYNLRPIVLGIGLNSGSVENYLGLGTDLDLHVRFGKNRHLAGIGAEALFSLNKKSYAGQEIDWFTGDTSDVQLGLGLYTIAYKLEYHYFLMNPNKHQFAIRVGGGFGPELQIPESDAFSFVVIVDGKLLPDLTVGMIVAPVIGFEYFFGNASFFCELGGAYHLISKRITYVNGRNQFGGNLKLGMRFNLGPKSKFQ